MICPGQIAYCCKQGWRLDPLLLLCQLFTTTIALNYALEALQARRTTPANQVCELVANCGRAELPEKDCFDCFECTEAATDRVVGRSCASDQFAISPGGNVPNASLFASAEQHITLFLVRGCPG